MQEVHVTIGDTEFTTALFPRDGRYLASASEGGGAAGGGDRVRARSSRWSCVSAPRAGNDERMDLRQPDDQVIAVEVWSSTATPRAIQGAHAQWVMGTHLRRCEPTAQR